MNVGAAELRIGVAQLIVAAGELATKHVYLDPHDKAPDSMVRAYCALCLRYGANCASIDHAASCAVGRVIDCLNELPARLLAHDFNSSNPSERTSANSSAPVEQEGAAAEGLVRVPQHYAALRVEYFAESPRNKFNPYMNPCPGIRSSVVCELESGHPGAHCNNGEVWADDCIAVDISRRLA